MAATVHLITEVDVSEPRRRIARFGVVGVTAMGMFGYGARAKRRGAGGAPARAAAGKA